MLARHRLAALESFNHFLFMTFCGDSMSPELLWLTDDVSDTLSLLDSFEDSERLLLCWADILNIEDGSWYLYKDIKDPSVSNELSNSERIKHEIDRRCFFGSLKSNWSYPYMSCLGH